jgi:hypothetical protein
MRRLLLAFLIGTAALATGVSLAGTGAESNRVACRAKAIDIYFWPKGHPAIPSLGFPAFRSPHVEVYRAGRVAGTAQLAYLSAKGAAFAKSCKNVGDTATRWASAKKRLTSAQVRIRCRLAQPMELAASALADNNGQINGEKMVVIRGHTPATFALIQVTQTGSQLEYVRSVCTPVAIKR